MSGGRKFSLMGFLHETKDFLSARRENDRYESAVAWHQPERRSLRRFARVPGTVVTLRDSSSYFVAFVPSLGSK